MSSEPIAILKRLITQERAEKAFKKTKSDQRFAVEGCQLELIKENRYEDMMAFCRDYYLPDEPMAKSLNVLWDEDMQNIIKTNLKHGLSIALVSSETGEIIGGQIIVLANKHEKIKYKSAVITKYFEAAFCFESLDIFEHYNVEEVVHLCQLAVHNERRQKGIGTTLIGAAIAFAKNFDVGPMVLRVEGSSIFSKRIFEKLGFDILAETVFADYKVDGKVVIAHSGDHKSVRLYGMIVG